VELWVDVRNSGLLRGDETKKKYGILREWRGPTGEVAHVLIEGPEGQNEAISHIGTVEWILVECMDWTMIPLENIISYSFGTGTKIAAAVSSEKDLNGVFHALEHGVDAIMVPPNIAMIKAVHAEIENKVKSEVEEEYERPPLSYSEVTEVRQVGVGERVCIDLIERMENREGMLIGSLANALMFIHGETVPSQYVPVRPFRVNAGSIHSYCLMADGRTKYLSELKSGERIAVVNSNGDVRGSVIGRLKIERRPFVMINYRSGEINGQIILQQAETIRMIGEKGMISTTEVKVGDKVLTRLDGQMRHIGRGLQGTMIER
tara:strand:+ start:7053 stop:8009 length:957 start_codon:yes stop_codon:yes gene_type:complete